MILTRTCFDRQLEDFSLKTKANRKRSRRAKTGYNGHIQITVNFAINLTYTNLNKRNDYFYVFYIVQYYFDLNSDQGFK